MESWREFNGGNRGTEDLAKHQLAAERSMLTDGEGPFGWIGRKRRDAYAPEELAQQQRNTAETLTVHKSEKVKLAERNAEVLNKFALVASFIIGNPWLAIAFDAAVHAAKSKMKEAIAGEAYDESGDLRDFGVNMGIDAIFIALHANALAAAAGAGGGGLKPPPGAGTTAAISGRAATEAVDNAVTNEAKEAAVDQAVKDVATSAGATEKQVAGTGKGDATAKAASDATDAQKSAAAAEEGASAGKPGADSAETRSGDGADDVANEASDVSTPRGSTGGVPTPSGAPRPLTPEEAKQSLHASPAAQRILTGKRVDPHEALGFIDKFGEEGVKAADRLMSAVDPATGLTLTPNQAMRIIKLAERKKVSGDVVSMINSGRLQNLGEFMKWMEDLVKDGKKDGKLTELLFAAERAREGKDVSVGGRDLVVGDAMSGRGDVVVYGKEGAAEVYQVKKLKTSRVDGVQSEAKNAIDQLHGDNEIAPVGAKKIAHVSITNPANDLYTADEATLTGRLKDAIAAMKPGDELVIINGTGTHRIGKPAP